MNTTEAAISKLITVTYPNLVKASDAVGYASLYAEQVLWSPPNGPDQRTRDGVENGIRGIFQKMQISPIITIDEIKVMDNVAWVSAMVDGVTKNNESGEAGTINFRGIWLLEQIEGDWKISRQIWNNKPGSKFL